MLCYVMQFLITSEKRLAAYKACRQARKCELAHGNTSVALECRVPTNGV